ncbi:hypothetical protein MMC11_009167 [Xylographa trunciseda]|nr:hypothetical protein [Xylographa trunciseda]
MAFLLDSLASNDTLINDVGDFCDNTTSLIQCQYNAGGQLDVGASSTWSQASNAAAAGADPYDSDLDPGDIFGTDVLQVNTNAELKKYPMGILRGSNSHPNAIGMEENSTFLNALQAAKLIPSRTWSLFWGLAGAEPSSQMDGSLVIGGYDAAKTTGSNSTQPTTKGQGCNLLVTMTAINLNFPNGTNFNILGTSHGAALRMCVSPIYPIITIPYDIWQNFLAFGGGTYIGRSVGINLWGEVFSSEGVYDGDISFTLSSGLVIRIPNNQLVVPDINIDSDGVPTSNVSTREILLNSLQEVNQNDLPLLGRTFLTSAYLHVNYDLNQFTLWQANPTLNESIVAVGSSGSPSCTSTASPAIILSTPAVTGTASGSPTSSAIAAPAVQNDKSVPTGAIVGAAVGGAAVIGIIAAIVLLLCFRRSRAPVNRYSDGYSDIKPYTPPITNPMELSSYQEPQEIGEPQRHEMSS